MKDNKEEKSGLKIQITMDYLSKYWDYAQENTIKSLKENILSRIEQDLDYEIQKFIESKENADKRISESKKLLKDLSEA